MEKANFLDAQKKLKMNFETMGTADNDVVVVLPTKGTGSLEDSRSSTSVTLMMPRK